MSALLQVRGVGKAYRRWSSELLRAASWFKLPVRPLEEHWVLRDICFSIDPGQTVGIVGQNGAGKSTLLKLITGTTQPTEGVVSRIGRVAAILELGMGFNPDLSGRENVFHAAGLMGFGRDQIDAAMSGIEEFAEIGTYFDEPVRTYSSGMQVRVAFSVATAFRPDLLIIDEALSVGDAYFQHKCFERVRQFQELGTSLLIVSHDPTAILALCTRAILLEQGRAIRDGNPQDVLDYYNALIAERENMTVRETMHASGRQSVISGTGEASVESLSLRDSIGRPVEHVNVGEHVELRLLVRVHADIPRLVLGYMIKDRLGQPVFGTNTFHTEQILENLRAGQLVEYRARFALNLGPGSYSVSTALVSSDTHLVNNYEWRDLAMVFTVSNMDKPYFVGGSWIPPQIEVLRQ